MEKEFIKVLGALLDESLTLKEHLKCIKKKIAKNLTLFKKARPILEKKFPTGSLLLMHYIHTYLNYANITWGSTYRKTNFQKVYSQEKKCNIFAFNKEIYQHGGILKEHRSLIVHVMNILSKIIFIHRIGNKTAHSTFLTNSVNLHMHTQIFSTF